MNKFEQILRKNIQAVTFLDTVQTQTGRVDEYPPEQFPCNNKNRPSLNLEAICEAVNKLRSPPNQPGDNKCAQFISKYHHNPCEEQLKKYLKGETVIDKCNDYASAVVLALPNRATNPEKAEAKRKARCDCLNFALVGRPALNPSSVRFEAKIMQSQIEDFYKADCEYTRLVRVCEARQKVADELISISPLCPVPPYN